MFRKWLVLAWIFGLIVALGSCPLMAQDSQAKPRVGIVLSGGGAKGSAHVGFMLALEEMGVPLDFIVGASVGGLVGGYYAAGWSPLEMKHLLKSPAFQERTSGDSGWKFGFKESGQNPGLFQVRLSSGDGAMKGQLVSGLPMDWALMEELSPAEARAQSDFDRLMVPFRCVASDVVQKEDTTFSSGNLATAVRASMTFPFYLEPVLIDGRPFYDGGLYNNFPVDVMQREFAPDLIIGCSVGSDAVSLDSDDLAIQIETIMTRPQKLYAENEGLIIVKPVLNLGTFDFDRVAEGLDAGYAAAMASMPRILEQLRRLGWTSKEGGPGIEEVRSQFRKQLRPFAVGDVQVVGLNPQQEAYASALLTGRNSADRKESLERNLYLLSSDSHIGRIRPESQWNRQTGLFDVTVQVREERDLLFAAGGNLSSRPVSFGYASAAYSRFGRIPSTIRFSTTFGSLYSAVRLDGRMDFHGGIPIAIQPYYLVHRWNYVRSLSTFFQDVRPSFLVSNESELGLELLIPTGDRSVLKVFQAHLSTDDFTYPEWEFTPADTSDFSGFEGWVTGVDWHSSSLDDKQFARLGSRMQLSLRRFTGEVNAVYEDPIAYPIRTNLHKEAVGFFRLSGDFEQYVTTKREALSVGFRGEFRLSDEALRSTYRASLAQATPFEPMPGAKSLFLEGFRSYNYVAAGIIVDLRILKSIRWRSEAHAMHSYGEINDSPKGPVIQKRESLQLMAGSWLVAKSSVGLFSIGAEYFQGERNPLMVEFSWGYRLFQSSIRR